MISFTHESRDLSEVHSRLDQASIVTSLRHDRLGRKYIRISPHFYNTDAELQRLVELV